MSANTIAVNDASTRQANAVRAGRPWIHRLYYLLAAFDLIAVLAGLFLSHHINGVLTKTVEDNRSWNLLHDQLSEIRRAAGDINAPGNDVFESKDARRELQRLHLAVEKYTPLLSRLRAKVDSDLDASSRQGPREALSGVDKAMSTMVAQSIALLDYYAAGNMDAAVREMPAMDRSYADALGNIEEASRAFRHVENEMGNQQAKEVQDLRVFEYLLGAFVIVMVTVIAVYGHKMGKVFLAQFHQLSLFNSLLEVRIAERTAELEKANQDIRGLNIDLETRMRALKQMRDEQDKYEEVLKSQNMKFSAALENMPHGLCMFDAESRLIVSNKVFADMYGLSPDLLVPGVSLQVIQQARIAKGTAPKSGPSLSSWLANEPPNENTDVRESELEDGRIAAVIRRPMEDGGWVSVHMDITERKRIEDKITHMAHHDALTGLPNRVLLSDHILSSLAQMRRGNETIAVLCLDLDHFKHVNDTLGHQVGDALLCAVAERLRSCVRESDIVARTGGDEFSIVQTGADQPQAAAGLAERIVELLSAPFDLGSHQVVIGTSVGISMAPADGAEPDQLLKNADLAMYRAKTNGRGMYCFFAAEMDARAQARRLLELDLRKAVATGEFEVFYQPIVNLKENRISGFEALLRWNHPTRGRISPEEFIPLAEETGLITAIGEWVIRQACAEAGTWPVDLRIAVNVSPVQFRSKTLISTIISALASSGLSPMRLELEITEAVLLHDNETTLTVLHQLRDLGVKISMDDFGTGYSSLSYLRSFPFDKIKIDQSFIRDLAEKPDSIAIVRAVTGLGKSFGMVTTAEGVETQSQLDQMRAEGCTEVQGYFFGRPTAAIEIPGILDAFQRRVKAA